MHGHIRLSAADCACVVTCLERYLDELRKQGNGTWSITAVANISNLHQRFERLSDRLADLNAAKVLHDQAGRKSATRKATTFKGARHG
jgi:hypothetical protein